MNNIIYIMLKQKKIINLFLVIFITFFFLKLIDFFLYKFYGLGNPILYSSSKQFGYQIKPNQKVIRRGNEISINQFGMRSSKNWNQDLNDNKFRILFFGDSVTYGGSIVDDKEIFSEIVCKLLTNDNNNYLCGNYGVNGYSLYSIIRKLKYTDLSSVDLIVLTLITNDFDRSFHNIISQPFWSKKINNYYPALTELIFIYLDKFRNKIKYDLGNEEKFSKIDNVYYNDLIFELDDVLKKKQINFLILYSPTINEKNNLNHNKYFITKLKNLENFYDLSIIKDPKNNLYFDNVHLNKFGHEIYAKYISNIIKKFITKKN